MKISKFSLVLFSLLALLSCSKKKAEPQQSEEGNSLEITAIQTSTKTHLGERDGGTAPILWDAADQIWVRSAAQQDGTPGTKFTTTASSFKESGRSAIFKGTAPQDGPYVAVYPFSYVLDASTNSTVVLSVPKTQTYAAKSFGAQANLTAAVWKEGKVATFENLVGTVKITLTNEMGIKKVVVTDNDPSSILWGRCTLIPNKEGTALSSVSWSNGAVDKNVLTLDCSGAADQNDPKGTMDYFLSVPAGAFKTGFTVELYDASGSLVKTIVAEDDCTVARGTVIDVNKEDPELTYFSGGDGSVADPYRISTPADLVAISDCCSENYDKFASAHYVLTADLNMQNKRCGIICKSASQPFKGSFDGCGFTIANLTPYVATSNAYGLFGYADGATFSNVKIAGFKVGTCSGNGGTVVGFATKCDISNINVDGPLHYTGVSCGSVVGTMKGGNLSDCTYNGFIQNESTGIFDGKNSSTTIGGIVGSANDNATIKNCSVLGNVTGKGMFVGGIIGSLYSSTVESCIVRTGSTVVGDNYDAGGISGWMRGTAVIKNCSVDASIACWYHELGGICCWVEGGKILDCVVGSNSQIRCGMGKVGGIAGIVNSSSKMDVEINGCVVYGDVTGTWSVGGIVGQLEPKADGSKVNIVNCAYEGGEIWSAGYYTNSDGAFALVGGIVGWARLGGVSSGEFSILNCYSNPACLRVEWDKATKLGIAGILGNTSGSAPMTVSRCYTSLTNDRLRFGTSSDFSGQTRYGSVGGTVGTNVTFDHICYPAGARFSNNAESLKKTDISTFTVTQATSGALLKQMNDNVASYSGSFQLRKWVASASGYPIFEGMLANPTVGQKAPLRVSLIGDSLSSFDGYVPHAYKNTTEGDANIGYRSHYPCGDGNVTTAAQTYWYILTYNLLKNAILDTNLAFSGTAVARCTNTSKQSEYWYNQDFCKRYIENGGMGSPDIILINGGANDWSRSSYFKMLGSMSTSSATPPSDAAMNAAFAVVDACTTMEEAKKLPDTTFVEAYLKLLKMIMIQYPNVKIVVVIHDTISVGMEKSLIKMSDHYPNYCRYVDLYAVNGFNDLGFNGEYLAKGYQPNMPKHDFDWSIKTITGHGDHPSAEGMKFIANKIYSDVGAWLESGFSWSDASEGGLSNMDNINGIW